MPTLQLDPPIPTRAVEHHQAQAVALLKDQKADGLLLFSAGNILGFSGVPLEPSDRLVCALLNRSGDVAVVLPAFEAEIANVAPTALQQFTWDEHEDPFGAVRDAADALGLSAGRILLDGRTWAETHANIVEVLPKARCVVDPGIIRAVRIVKNADEVSAIAAACEDTGQIYDQIQKRLRSGINEMQLAREVLEALRSRGLDPFGELIQGGESASIPHQPTGQRVFRDGDAVIVDFVARRDSYLGDMTRTFALGDVTEEVREAYRAVRAAQKAAIDSIGPGVECQAVDAAARRAIEEAGLGDYFVHRTGHGIGLEVHEPPYLVRGNREQLAAGMCVTVEPGVYVPGKFGVRIEDVVEVTTSGGRVLSKSVPTDVSSAFKD